MPRHDEGLRRRAQRTGREKGCWVYIAAEQLARMGYGLNDPPPYYRTWVGGSRPRLIVNLYREA